MKIEEWISVATKLPEPGKRVLLAMKGHDLHGYGIGVGYMLPKSNKPTDDRGWMFNGLPYSPNAITHWSELPAHPGEYLSD